MSEYNDDMPPREAQDDRGHTVIESAEVLGPVFNAPVAYEAIKKLAESSAYAKLRTLADGRAPATSH